MVISSAYPVLIQAEEERKWTTVDETDEHDPVSESDSESVSAEIRRGKIPMQDARIPANVYGIIKP